MTQLALRLAVVALTGVLLFAALLWDNAANRGVGSDTSDPIRWADVPLGGVNTYGLHHEVVSPEQRRSGENKVARTFELIRAAGFHFVRVQFPWEDIEVCGKGEFLDCRGGTSGARQSTWTKYDYIVSQAREHDLELIVRLDRPPDWARRVARASPEVQAAQREGRPVVGPPDRFEDYADFVAAVARRYGDDLRFYQIWNEPNLPGEWNYRRQDPAEFVGLLRLASAAIKAEDPDAAILFPPLSPTDGEDGVATNDLEYLQGVYDAGGRDAFDIMSAQLYGLGQPPDEHRYIKLGDHVLRPFETRVDVGRVVLQREIMERNGDTAKSVWISEMGWNSAPPSLPQLWGAPVSEEEKARYLVGAMQRAEREWPWMGAMCIWIFRWGGEPPHPDDPTPYFQLVDFNFRPLPAYERVATFLHERASLPPARRSIPATVSSAFAALGVVAASAWLWPALVQFAGVTLAAVTRWAAVVRRRSRGRFAGAMSGVRAWHKGLDDRIVAALLLVGLAIFYRASAQLPLTLLGALIFGVAALLRPDLALLLVPVTAPLYLAPKGVWDARFGLDRPQGYFIPLHEFVLLATMGAALLHWLARWPDPRAVWSAVRRSPLPLLWLAAGTLGVLVAGGTARGAAMREWRWLVVEPLVFYALVQIYGSRREWRIRLLWSWLFTGVAIAALGMLQLVGLNLVPLIARQACFSEAVVFTGGVARATSVYCHPNNLGLALGRIWPVLAALALAPGAHRWSRTARSIANVMAMRRTLTIAALAIVVLCGLAASFSKGGILGALGALVVLGLLQQRRILLLAAAGATVAIALGGLLIGIERLNPLGGSSGARWELWSSAVTMLRDHPWFGIGLDQFIVLRNEGPPGRYMSDAAAATSERFASHPHNAVLDTLLRVGPVGLLVLVGLLVQFFQRGLNLLQGDQTGARALSAGLLASMVAALIHGLVDNFYFVPDLAFAFWLQFALIELEAAPDERHEPAPSPVSVEPLGRVQL